MAKKVAIILTNEFEDIELTSPKEAIEEAGHETVVIGDQANIINHQSLQVLRQQY
jgi:protease I